MEQNKSASVSALLVLVVLPRSAAREARSSGWAFTRRERKGERQEKLFVPWLFPELCHPQQPQTAEDGAWREMLAVDVFRDFTKSLKGTFMFLVNSTALNAAKFTAIK